MHEMTEKLNQFLKDNHMNSIIYTILWMPVPDNTVLNCIIYLNGLL